MPCFFIGALVIGLRVKYLLSSLLLGCTVLPVFAQMPQTELSVGMFRIEAEVALTQDDRMLGLMNRREMAAHHGMLFAFPVGARHCMWMRNTYLPLSVAFIDEKGVILNIEDMQPQTDTSHCAVAPALYALEMNRGWFSSKGVRPGTKIEGITRIPAAR